MVIGDGFERGLQIHPHRVGSAGSCGAAKSDVPFLGAAPQSGNGSFLLDIPVGNVPSAALLSKMVCQVASIREGS